VPDDAVQHQAEMERPPLNAGEREHHHPMKTPRHPEASPGDGRPPAWAAAGSEDEGRRRPEGDDEVQPQAEQRGGHATGEGGRAGMPLATNW
jgi:hypothetical protein